MRYETEKALAFLPCVIENASINCPFLFSEAIKSPVSYLISGISTYQMSINIFRQTIGKKRFILIIF